MRKIDIGDTMIYRGQAYTCESIEPYYNRKGRLVELNSWRSQCPDSGTVFNVLISARMKEFKPNRRCREHRAPGKRVKNLQAS